MATAENLNCTAVANMTSVETLLLVRRHQAELAILRKLVEDLMPLAKQAVLANPTLTKQYELAHMRAIALGVVNQ
jgi:hypothetical protein